MTSKLSIVVPVYNIYPYLRECLDSIINQTYKNLEIIIVNDASPFKEDDEICREYAAKDERVKYIIHEVNKGLGGGRNTGINNATGKYITFIDSDDYLCDKNAYKKCIEVFNKINNLNLVFFNYLMEYNDKIKEKSCIEKEMFNKLIKLEKGAFKLVNATWNKIYKLEDIINNKLYFPEKLKFEDMEFWFKYQIALEPTIYGINGEFYCYRQQEGSITHNLDKYILDYVSIFDNMYEYYKSKDEKWRELYISYLPHLKNIEPYINDLDDKEKRKLTDGIMDIMKKMSITEEEFRKILGFEFYKVLFGNKYIYNMFSETERKMNKYAFVKENIILYKLKREIKRIINQIKELKNRDK